MITVLLITYDRPREIRCTIDALRVHLHYSGALRWHIADDSSPADYIPQLVRDYPDLGLIATTTQRQGWGANVNRALQHPQMTDLIFLCEDDYVAKRDIDLDFGAALLMGSDLGVVRYDGIAGHVGLNLWLKEYDTALGRLNCLKVDQRHSTHLNVYSNRPHLRHRRFHDTFGLYKENLPLGKTEEEYAHRILDKNGPGIAILPDGIPTAFDHIGVSRQGTDKDSLFKH